MIYGHPAPPAPPPPPNGPQKLRDRLIGGLSKPTYHPHYPHTPPPPPPPGADALRFNTGKPQLRYILTFPNALAAFARVCMYGAGKYAAYNYLRGAPTSQYVDCLLRHLTAWLGGEEFDTGDPDDPDDHGSGQSHLAHVVWNALALCQIALTQPLRDDRPHVVMAAQDAEPQPATR